MKLWIRLDAGTPRDPKITELARALNVRRAEAFGLAASVWCVMAEHAVDGDLSTIADEDIEAWAYWQGKRGKFAAAFRAAFVGPDGMVGGWSDRQGALLERMERDRKRHRKPDGGSEEPPRNSGGNSAETPRSLLGDSTSTVRNVTEQTTKALRAQKRTVPKYPHFSHEMCDRLYASWRALGVPDYATFRGTFGRLFPEQPQFTIEQVAAAIGAYIEDAKLAGTTQFASPKAFVERIQHWVDMTTPIAQRDPSRAWQLGVAS